MLSMEKEVKLPEMFSNKQLRKLSKASKTLRNRRIRHLLSSLSTVDSIWRRDLKNRLEVSESTLSDYLSSLENSSLVKLQKIGRQVHVQISPFGRRLLDSCNDLDTFAHISSDGHRVRILEFIAGNSDVTYTEAYYAINRILAGTKQPEMTTALLSYHLRILKKEEILRSNNSEYRLTSKGRRIVQSLNSLFS